jgi:SagB-type dehydrogenase family enzyme
MNTQTGAEFWEKTKYAYLPASDQEEGLVPQPPLEIELENADLLALPEAANLNLPDADLWETIQNRKTLRNYSPQALSLEELAALLWYTQGVKRVTPRPVTLRTVPSAGARHPFETYLLVNRVDGLTPGLYRYAAGQHALVPLNQTPEIGAQVYAGCMKQNQVPDSAVTFIWAAVIERTEWRYPGRGYRYILLDAGHVCQNLYLAAEGIGCGVCAIAAYDDDLLNQAIGVDGHKIFAAYVATVGKRAAN